MKLSKQYCIFVSTMTIGSILAGGSLVLIGFFIPAPWCVIPMFIVLTSEIFLFLKLLDKYSSLIDDVFS